MPAFNQLVHAWLMPSRGILRTFNNAGITRLLTPAGGKGRPVDLNGLPSYSAASNDTYTAIIVFYHLRFLLRNYISILPSVCPSFCHLLIFKL